MAFRAKILLNVQVFCIFNSMKYKFLKLSGIVIFMFGIIASTVYHTTSGEDILWLDFVLGTITGVGIGLTIALIRKKSA